MYIGQYTVNVESGIKEDAASISGSVSETVGYFSIKSVRSLTFASDDSTPGSEVSIDCFTFYQECISNQHIISLPMPDIGAILHAGELHLHAGWQRRAAIIRYPGHITSSF